MYRGWYKGERDVGQRAGAVGVLPGRVERPVPRRPGLPDQRHGEGRTCAGRPRQFRAGNLWHRWDYPHELGSERLRRPASRLRATTSPTTGAPSAPGASRRSPRGSTGILEAARRRRPGAARNCRSTGSISSGPGSARTTSTSSTNDMDLAFERDGLDPDGGGAGAAPQQPAAAGLHRRPSRRASRARTTTSCPGETVEKQLILINNSRDAVSCDCEWSLGLPQTGRRQPRSCHRARRASRQRIPVALRAAGRAGRRPVRADGHRPRSATARRSRIPSRSMSCRAPPSPVGRARRIALFDPKGETGKRWRRWASRSSPWTPTPICRATTC